MYQQKLIIAFLILTLVACKSEYEFVIQSPKKIKVNQELSLLVKEKNAKEFDSVQFSIDGKKIKSQGEKANKKISLDEFKLGKNIITAVIFYENSTKTKKVTKPIYFMASKPPVVYSFKIINSYPHDNKAYTQGLEYYNGLLYEGTGKKGESTVRKVEIRTGKVIEKVDLDATYFGEGITILNDKIYQLTWQGGKGIKYDLATLKKEGEFNYNKSIEGWGLANDGEKIYKSDGTERIWILNPETLVEEDYIEVYSNSQKVEKLNELEYVNGKIYANRWQLNSIIIINPKNGMVEGVVDLDGLKKELEKTHPVTNSEEVLNGIAYDSVNDRLFVTGKNWGKLYEIILQK